MFPLAAALGLSLVAGAIYLSAWSLRASVALVVLVVALAFLCEYLTSRRQAP